MAAGLNVFNALSSSSDHRSRLLAVSLIALDMLHVYLVIQERLIIWEHLIIWEGDDPSLRKPSDL